MFNNPSNNSQPTSMFAVPLGDHGDNAALAHRLSMVLGVVCRVGLDRSGRWRGRPRLPLMGGMWSIKGISSFTSFTLAADKMATRGMPFLSVAIWCLLPGLRRSVGLGPVLGPPHIARIRALSMIARDQSIFSGRSTPRAAVRAVVATHRQPASPAIVANTSCRNRNPFPVAATPMEFPSATQTECRSTPPVCRPMGDHLWDVAATVEARAQCAPTTHQKEVALTS